MKKLILILAIWCSLSSVACANPLYTTYKTAHGYTTGFYLGSDSCLVRTAKKPQVKFTRKLTAKMLRQRKANNIIYVEIIQGKVTDNKGNGRTDAGAYIKYHGLRKGTKVKTYLVYDPTTKAIDDVIYRFDEVL